MDTRSGLTHAPAPINLPRAIHRLDGANSVVSCAVLFHPSAVANPDEADLALLDVTGADVASSPRPHPVRHQKVLGSASARDIHRAAADTEYGTVLPPLAIHASMPPRYQYTFVYPAAIACNDAL